MRQSFRQRSLSLVNVEDSGHLAATSDPLRHSWLARSEFRDDDWSAALIVAQPERRGAFAGAHAQLTLNDDWMVCGEASSLTRTAALDSPADVAQPFHVRAESARRGVALAGLARGFAGGQTFNVEYLYNGQGYTRAETEACFARAAASLPVAGIALAYAPPLLGRNYLHLLFGRPARSVRAATGGYVHAQSGCRSQRGRSLCRASARQPSERLCPCRGKRWRAAARIRQPDPQRTHRGPALRLP